MSAITTEAKQEEQSARIIDRKEATAKLITPKKNVVTVIGTDEIRDALEKGSLDQACNIADAPGIEKFVLNPDAHLGKGCPIGSVFGSKTMLFPSAVGPDINCGMSFLQLNVHADDIKDKRLRREIIKALEERIPLGMGSRQATKARTVDMTVSSEAAIYGANKSALGQLGIPTEWSQFCEQASYSDPEILQKRLSTLYENNTILKEKLKQIGSVGGGNHFMECDVVKVQPGMEKVAEAFGLIDGNVGFLCHFGSRGFGFFLTEGGRGGYPGQFRKLASHFNKWHIEFPGGDVHNVYIPYDTPEADEYLADMSLGANFATVNHLLTQAYVIEAFQQVLGNQVTGKLVYHISHNIIRWETVEDERGKQVPMWVHRKGATRALPAGHHLLKGTPFYGAGHPVLLPGNPIDGSMIMVGQPGSRIALNSINHGASRTMSRTKARENFKQKDVDAHFESVDILTNCRQYPVDECSRAYKPYNAVIDSVVRAGLAKAVATLTPRLVIKDADQSAEGSA